jgi:hypothetical protein
MLAKLIWRSKSPYRACKMAVRSELLLPLIRTGWSVRPLWPLSSGASIDIKPRLILCPRFCRKKRGQSKSGGRPGRLVRRAVRRLLAPASRPTATGAGYLVAVIRLRVGRLRSDFFFKPIAWTICESAPYWPTTASLAPPTLS